MSIEDELAERLYKMSEGYWGPSHEVVPWSAVSPHVVERFKLIARECLRVAEWARRCVSTSGPMTLEREDEPGWVKILTPHTIHLGELRLPPEGWVP